MNLTNLTVSAFTRIVKLLKKKEALLERVAKVERKLAAFGTGKPGVKKRAGKKRRMSAAGRKAIAAAQRKRWAKIKAQKQGR